MAVRYRAYYTSGRGNEYRADVWDKTYTGPIRAFDAGPDGHIITTEGDEDSRFAPIKGTRCTLPILVENALLDDFIEEIASRPERDFAILIYQNDVLDWFGFVAPDLLQQDDISYPYIVELTATDGLGSLKMPYDFTGLSISNVFRTVQEFVHELLSYNGLASLVPAHHQWLRVNFDWHAQLLGPFTLATQYTATATAGEFTIDANAITLAEARRTAGRRTGISVLSVFGMAYRQSATDGDFALDVDDLNAALSRAQSSALVSTGNYGSDTRNEWEQANIQRVGLVNNFGSQSSFTPPAVGEMLARIMQSFGARIYFDGGAFCVDQVRSLASRYVDVHVYYPSGQKAFVIDQEDRQLELNQASQITKRLAGGMRRYMRPLREVIVNFQPNLNMNLANVRNQQGLIMTGTFEASSLYEYVYRGTYRVKKIATVDGAQFYFKVLIGIQIKLDVPGSPVSYYLTNGDPLDAPSQRYYWKPEAVRWQSRSILLGPLYYNFYITELTQQGNLEGSTVIEFDLPALPVNGNISITSHFRGVVNAVNQFRSPEIAQFDVNVLLAEGNRATSDEGFYVKFNDEIDNQQVEYKVTRNTSDDSSQIIDNLPLGDGPVAFLPSSVVFKGSGNPFIALSSGGWKRYAADAYEEMGQLLASEIMYGQQKAITKFDMVVLSSTPVRLRNILKIGSRSFVFNGVKKYALVDECEGTWFEVAEDVSGLTKSKQRLLRAFASQPVALASIGSGGDPVEPALDLGINIMRRMQVTELTNALTAGTYTTLPITAIGEAFLQAGDRLGLVNLGTGQIIDVQLAAAVSASATSVTINSVALPDLPVGSFVIFTGQRLARMVKKIDSGTIANLPITSAGIGNETTPIQIDASTGNVRTDGDLAVQEITASDVVANEITAAVALKAGTEVQIDGITGKIDATGNISTAGNVSGDEVIAAVALKAGSVFEVNAATGDVATDGDITAAGNMAAAQVQADQLLAGTKVTINAATGDITNDGDVVTQGEVSSATAIKAGVLITLDAETGKVNSAEIETSGDVKVGRFLEVEDEAQLKGALVLTGLDESFVENYRVYLESDDAGAFYLKIKV